MTKLYLYLAAAITIFSLSLVAHADDSNSNANSNDATAVAPKSDANQTTMKVDDTKKKNTIQGANEIDELLTNNNLRALSGSTSKWSMASIFNYNGGTISSPLSQDRPNISDASGNTVKADLDGTINVKYNLGVKDSLLLGIGVRWIAPLATGGPSNYNGTTFDAINPQLTYQHIYKLGGMQNVVQVTGMQWTQADQTALGYDKNINIDQATMYQVPGTKFSAGFDAFAQYQTFDKSGSYGTPGTDNYIADLGTAQSQYEFGLVPEFEYQLTEKINLRTTIGLWIFEHYVAANENTYAHDTIYESVGVGCSLTRNIFLYPNIQFLPENIRSDLTNVGLTATINLF